MMIATVPKHGQQFKVVWVLECCTLCFHCCSFLHHIELSPVSTQQ